MNGWLYFAGYLALFPIVFFTVRGFLSLWADPEPQDEVEDVVRRFRRELDTWDSSLFLEDADREER